MVHLERGDQETARLTFSELDRRARAIAAVLARADLRGRPVLLIYPSGPEFVEAFCACLYAGAIAAPAPFLTPNRALERVRRIAAHTKPAAVLTVRNMLANLRVDPSETPELSAVPWIVTDAIPDEAAGDATGPWAGTPSDPALLQYSSGSTGRPKGVVVTYGNLHANLDMLAAAFGANEGSVFVNWLPMFHDMGLISALLHSLYAGATCVLMPPTAFLQRPLRWLQAIDRYGGTISGAPNFAFDLCAARAGGQDLSGLDLRSWEVAYCAAEPVRAGTLERFADSLAASRFRRSALYPCYGLAEATVFVSGPAGRKGVRTFVADAQALARNEVSRPTLGAPIRTLVSCGAPWLDQAIAIVDPETFVPLPEARVGEIWAAGPHVAAGYWEAPTETADAFAAALPGAAGTRFLRTGDLGTLIDGELYVTGRLKDLIVVRGANLHPGDIEAVVTGCHSAFAADRAGAFCIDVDEEERVVVACEVTRHHVRSPDVADLVGAAVEAVNREFGIRLHDLVILHPNALPRTTSGKVQRRQCRQGYMDGTLRMVEVGALSPGLGIGRRPRTLSPTPSSRTDEAP